MSDAWVIMPVMGAPELTETAIDDVLAQTVAPNLLIVNQGVDQAFRERLERLAEFHSGQIFVWSHQPPLPSLAATWNRALDFCWAIGCAKALVVNNDVRLDPWTLAILQIRQAVERTPEKVGLVTSGTRIPIVSEETWRENPAPVTMLGAWQFKDAFLDREAGYLRDGGSFLLPLPAVEVIYGRA